MKRRNGISFFIEYVCSECCSVVVERQSKYTVLYLHQQLVSLESLIRKHGSNSSRKPLSPLNWVRCSDVMELVQTTIPKTTTVLFVEETDDGAGDRDVPNVTLEKRTKGSTSTRAARNYIFAASIAITLCIVCPQSNLWNGIDGSLDMST